MTQNLIRFRSNAAYEQWRLCASGDHCALVDRTPNRTWVAISTMKDGGWTEEFQRCIAVRQVHPQGGVTGLVYMPEEANMRRTLRLEEEMHDAE